MQWLITGAGAIGGYFGARLAQAGRDVAFLVHKGRYAQLQDTGLWVYSQLGDFHVARPRCLLAPEVKQDYDVVVVACKAYQLDSVIRDIRPAVRAKTRVVPFLNGFAHLEMLGNAFGRDKVLGGMCVISAELDAQGAIRHLGGQHDFQIGQLGDGPDVYVERILAELDSCLLNVEHSRDIVRSMWHKWVLIASLAGATCLLRASVGDIVEAGAANIPLALLDECSRIAAFNGFPLDDETAGRIRALLTTKGSKITASMLKDVERSSATECDHILGQLLAHARGMEQGPMLLSIAYQHLLAYEARRKRQLCAT